MYTTFSVERKRDDLDPESPGVAIIEGYTISIIPKANPPGLTMAPGGLRSKLLSRKHKKKERLLKLTHRTSLQDLINAISRSAPNPYWSH